MIMIAPTLELFAILLALLGISQNLSRIAKALERRP
jgi:hypothetical protein